MKFIISLDNVQLLAKSIHKTLYQALNYLYYTIPHFCYNEKLFIAGNCRMCLIEIANMPKLVVSCALPITNNMTILTKSASVLKARENVLEFLLINHPLDCPVCDQGGECDLQNLSVSYGQNLSKFLFQKASKNKQNINSFIRTKLNRCINCTKCIRLSYYIGVSKLSLFGRSVQSAIANLNIYLAKSKLKNHELFSNIIDICPVGQLYK